MSNKSSHVPVKQAPNFKGTRTDGRFLDSKAAAQLRERRTHLKPLIIHAEKAKELQP